LAVKKGAQWLKKTALAQIIDQAMDENPAVIEVSKRLDRAVTPEDKEKVLDQSLRQLVNSLMIPMSYEDKVKASFSSRLP
jgi:hypothetical protein